MNNRIMAALLAFATALTIGVAPVKAEAAAVEAHQHVDANGNYICDVSGCTEHVHHLTAVNAENATCRENGNIAFWRCLGGVGHCGKYYADANAAQEITQEETVVKATGHDLKWEYTEQKHTFKCANCKYGDSENHDLKSADNGNGTHTTTCKKESCGYTKTAEHVDQVGGNGKGDCICDWCGAKLEHRYSEWKPAVDKTQHYKQCAGCGEYKYEKHTFDDVSNMGDFTHGKACKTCGYKVESEECKDTNGDHKCETCGGPVRHNYDAADMKLVHKAPTCVEDGIWLHKQCQVCGLRMKENGTILDETTMVNPATGHEKGAFDCDSEGGWYACAHSGCTEKLDYHAHTFEQKHDADKHWKECPVCTYKLDVQSHDWERESNGDYSGNHKTTCKVCGQVNSEKNPCQDNDGDCRCDYCQAQVPHLREKLRTRGEEPATCDKSGVAKHYYCKTCEAIFKSEGGNCIPTTREELAIKPLGHALKWNANATSHWQVCTRDGCKHTTEKAQHDGFVSNGDGNHHIECKTCGANANKPKPCEDKNEDCLCDLCGGVMPHSPKENRSAFTLIAKKEPTCTTDGNSSYYECKTCKRAFVYGGAPIDPFKGMEATGHKWEYYGYLGDKHLVSCSCGENNTIACKDENGDCKCDLPVRGKDVCGKLMHSHTLVHVDRVEPTCEKAGAEEYLKYEGCGKMFNMNQKPISAPAEIPALGHDFGGVYEIVENGHALKCSRCDAKQEAQPHADENADNRCDICGAGLRLVEVPGVAPTCTDIGYETCWKSEITQQLYADADGKQPIESRKVIEKLGHAMSEWVDNGNGGHNRHCTREGCQQEQNENHTNKDGSCVCDVCHAPVLNHKLTYHEAVKANCTKGGVEAYYECTCGKLYDGETKEPMAAVKTTPALGHKLSAEKVKNARGDNHYQVCTREGCDYREYAGHAFQIEDPRSGNYHQMTCDCGHVKTEVHYDKNGDKSCDVCGHDMSNTSVDVGKHDSENVVTGDKDTVDNSKSWWQNWWNNIFGSNAGVASSGNTRAEAAPEKPAAQAPSQSQAKPAPQAPQAPQASQSSGQTDAVQQPAEKTETQPVQKEPGFIQQFIQSFSNFFYTLFGIG